MFRFSIKVKLLTFFVLAFLCLNAGGALCVAWCQNLDAKAETEHCPLAKLKNDCEKSEAGNSDNSDLDRFGTNEHGLDCCTLAISFFPAPIEKWSWPVQADLMTAAAEVFFAFRPPFDETRPPRASYYPPSLVSLPARIKHGVFRI